LSCEWFPEYVDGCSSAHAGLQLADERTHVEDKVVLQRLYFVSTVVSISNV
jgi:hypothetical protein